MKLKITDVKTIENLIKDVDFLKLEKLKLVIDRDFYSERNINDFMKKHHKFLIGIRMSLNIVKDCFDGVRADFVTRYHYNSELKLYVMSLKKEWDYTEEKARRGEVITDKQRVYLHIYYDDQKATDDKTRFNAMLDRLENNLVKGTLDPADEKRYQKYFTITETPVRDKVYSFIQFVALQMVSYIKKKMDENRLFSNYTIQSLLDELDIIESYR